MYPSFRKIINTPELRYALLLTSVILGNYVLEPKPAILRKYFENNDFIKFLLLVVLSYPLIGEPDTKKVVTLVILCFIFLVVYNQLRKIRVNEDELQDFRVNDV